MERPTRVEVNARMERVNIRGKQYATVDARVLAFWEIYPNGRIVTEMLSDTGDRCVFRATAYDMDVPIATGHAFEVRTSGPVNKTSYLENCETSAVGRALGFLGIGSNGSIASADEVQGAISQQEGADAPEGETATQTPPQPRRNRFEDMNEAKRACVEAGIPKESLDAWQSANVGPDARAYDDYQIKRCELHYRQLLEDKRELEA